MKKYEELSFDEKMEVRALFTIWLSRYTHEVVNKVMEKSQEIINNEFAMMMLKELAKRENDETADFETHIEALFTDYEEFKKYNPHNHPLQHSGSYRDVLYDMYIR